MSRLGSVAGPITGLASIFQSPVCSATPSGVRMAMALDSGIECATEMSSRSNGPTLNRLSSGTSLIGSCSLPPKSVTFDLSIAAVNGVA